MQLNEKSIEDIYNFHETRLFSLTNFCALQDSDFGTLLRQLEILGFVNRNDNWMDLGFRRHLGL